MIKLENAFKVFRTDTVETTALAGVNLQIGSGDFVAIMGPSGCGKSTLLSIIGMLDSLTGGRHIFNDMDVTKLSESKLAHLRRGNIGYIFQNYNLLDNLSVLNNVLLPLKFVKASKAEKKEMVKSALTVVGLEHRLEHKPSQLSGGQQQRVAIARAIVGKPRIILADEPTGNLDSQHSEKILELIRDINNSGTTIIMVTHSEKDARYTKKIVRMLDGKLLSIQER